MAMDVVSYPKNQGFGSALFTGSLNLDQEEHQTSSEIHNPISIHFTSLHSTLINEHSSISFPPQITLPNTTHHRHFSSTHLTNTHTVQLIKSNDGRDFDAIDLDTRTALLFVPRLGSEPCIKLLAEAGANVDHSDNNDGLTALHMAAGYVRPGVAKLLIDFGADSEIRDDRGRTPLKLAREILHLEKRGKYQNLEYLVKWKDGGVKFRVLFHFIYGGYFWNFSTKSLI